MLDRSCSFSTAAFFTCGCSNAIHVVNGSSLAVASIGTAAAPMTYLTIWNNSNALTVDMGLNGNPLSAISGVHARFRGYNTLNVLGYVFCRWDNSR